MEKLQRFSIRKLSIGAVSCLIGTVTFLGYSNNVQAAEKPQTVETTKAENEIQLEKAQESKPNEKAEGGTQSAVVDKNIVGSQANNAAVVNTSDQSKSEDSSAVASTSERNQLQTSQETNASSKSVQTGSPEQSADTTDVQPASDQVERAAANSNAPENNGHAASAPTALPKQPANSDTPSAVTTSEVQPFLNLAVESDNNDLTPKRETVDSTWTLHYVNQADHKQELKDPTVMTMQYTRTNTPQSDGTTQYGDWSYVPGSFKQTGTPITVKDSGNPVKQDNVDKNGENFDVFTIAAMYPTVAGYGFYNDINGTRLHDNLRNNERQTDAMSKDFYAEYDVAKPMSDTITSKWTIHYVKYGDHQQELKAPTVITRQYTRTNALQSNGKIRYGDWSYVPGSFKLTGTPIAVNGSDNPMKEDNVDKDGKNYDVFSIVVQHPDITGYELHNATNGVRISDLLQNDDSDGDILVMSPTMNNDRYVEYDVAKERSVAVKFVDDQYFKQQVGQAMTLTGHDGDTVNLNLTVPDKYQLADGQQLPTTYTFAKGSGDLTIHLVHKVVQREATIDFKLGLMTFVDFGNNSYEPAVITQAQWKQLEEEAKNGPVLPGGEIPFTEVGTLTGHVGYDLVDEEAVSFGDDWTSLNLGSRTYQMPNGTDVVNGILTDSNDTMGKKIKEYYLNEHQNWDSNKHVDPDYANRPWHGYLSVNATNNTQTPGSWDVIRSGMQAGLAGNEPNALAKATGDRAATSVELVNKTIDVNWLQDNLNFTASNFKEQDGQLQAKTGWEAFGVYIPYVEKTATRTINVTTPDGKTATVKQTATLAKQVDFGKDAHPSWTTGEWANYDVPTIPGYTASQLNVAKEAVTGATKDQTVNITYTANDGTQTIVYQDEDGSEVGKQVVPGKTDEKVKVTPEIPDGYVVKGEVPSEVTIKPDDTPITVTVEHGKSHVTPNKPVNKGDLIPDTKDKTYPSGLAHDDLNKTITREVTIIDPTGKKTTTTQTVTFTRGATVDEVTNEVTYDDWLENGKHTFDKVDVPTVQGYTASGDVPSLTVTPDSQSINVTVTYNANTQTAKITYIDDTTKTNLDSKDTSGKFGQAITFATAPADEIENYKKQGYVFVSSTFDNNKYQADNSNNIFYVHFVHGTKDVSRNSNVTMTVHYVMDDNSEAPSDNKQTVSFTENGIQDLVTKHIDWIPVDSQTFKDVVTPTMTGYTPDKENVAGQTVNFGDNDVEVTVHYTANTQTAKITYIDDTTKTNLDSKDTSGKFGQAITFATAPADEIASYEKQGYKLVSNDFNDNKYQADNNKNVFYVHFVHDTKKVNREHSASFTVHYIYKDGGQAKPDHEQTLNFTEDGIQDLVTQKITWTPADSQKFDDAITPVITGYTPDQDKVIGQTANFETGNREVTVTYSPNVQLGHINYIDDNTGKTLTRDDFSGRTNEHEDYTSTDRIQEFENKGYVFVSSDYPDGGFNFDNNDQQDQIFNVHLKHGTVTVTSKKPQIPNTPIDPDPHSPKYPEDIGNTNSDVKRTIDYKFKDGKTAQPTVKDNLHFERTVVIDKVTGDVLSDTWTPSQNFSDIQTPAIQGYTPDRTAVSDKNISHDHQDIIEHVVYSPDVQHMTITYIDDTTGKTLHTDNPTGVSDQDAKYTTSDTIKKYEDQHYKLVSDSTKGQDLVFDHNDNADQTYEVHFVHGKHAINQTTSPKQTIHYVYANGLARQGKAADDNVQQLSFKRDGYNDEVTGIDHWNAWTSANSNYNAVDSPVIQGYTPDKLVVEKSTVNPTDKDTEVTVTYSADKQAARVIYVDKTTNTTLVSKDLSGKSDEDSGYNTKDTIGTYQSQHYVLAGDETDGKNIVFDHDDQQDQTYYVHFVHDTQKVNRQDTVTSTIDYKFEDGKTAQPTVTQTKYFSENGIKDLVTGKITWDEAKPQKFEDVATKPIVGYTPDKDNVDGSTVKFGDKDITETVTYHNNAQKAVITYVDDMTNNTLASDSQDGKFDHEIAFSHKPSDVILGFEKAGYKLVSSNFKDGTKYKADDKQNEFIVHLTHDMQSVSRQDEVTETIHYVYEDGSESQPDHEQTISFNETGSKDLVTGKTTWDEAKPQKFEDVVTPKMTGYTPDTDNVVGSTVKFGDKDIDVTIGYTPNKQKAKVVFIDDTTKKILDTHDLTGVTNGHEKYNPSKEIEKFIHDNYVFVSSDYPEKGFTYDNDDSKDQVFEVHLKERPTESDTPIVPGNTEDNGGSNDTPTDSNNPEKDNGGSDTDKSNYKTPVKRNDHKKHHGTKKTNIQKNANKNHQSTKTTNIPKTSKTAKLNPNKVNAKTNKLTQTKLGKVQESTNNALPQTGEKHSNLMAMLGLAISSLGMIGTMKSKKRKDN